MTLLTTAFRATARLRRARAFHPQGVVLSATWRPAAEAVHTLGATPLLDTDRHAVVRLSHGIGLPPASPDLVGVAVKIPDAYGPGRDQDLLFTSSGRGVVSRHLLRPTRAATGAFSTIAPYALGSGGRHALLAISRPGDEVSYLDAVEGVVPPAFEVRVGRPDGPLLGTVHLDADTTPTDDQALAFDPWHTGPELRPSGWINRLRRPTYGASRAGRPRT